MKNNGRYQGRIPKCAGTVRTFGENHGTSRGNDNSEALLEKSHPGQSDLGSSAARKNHAGSPEPSDGDGFYKETLDIHNQGTGEIASGVTLEDTETCELHLLIDQKSHRILHQPGTLLRSRRDRGKCPGGNLLVKSEIPGG